MFIQTRHYNLITIYETLNQPIFSKPEERSQEFIDFVKLCLDKNPSQRATATELLQHNFITQNNTARGRDILLEVIHQAQEIKKRKKAKNQQTNRKNSDSRHENGPYFSKKSSDSDSGYNILLGFQVGIRSGYDGVKVGVNRG